MTARDSSPRVWRLKSRDLILDHPIVMGILNVTPDSFSDGGNFFSPSSAVAQAERMIGEGADIIDVGGESTRPGAIPIEIAEEWERVVPVIREIAQRFPSTVISIDTTKAEVAAAALDAGAEIVNDVSALRLDPEMPAAVARWRCGVVLMHSRGDVSNMASYDNAIYADVISEVSSELGSQILLAEDAGADRKAIAIDPGFGFSKTPHQSWELLHALPRLTSFDVPIVVGMSRKRMLASWRGTDMTIEEKDDATAKVNAMALGLGSSIFRVHNVSATRRALDEAWNAAQRANISS